MGLYIRKGRYYYKKQIEGVAYYKALKIKIGQERLLSERLKQVEEETIAKHFGLSYRSQDITFLDEYAKVYLKRNKDKKSIYRDKQTLNIICNYLDSPPLSAINKPHIMLLEEKLFERGKNGLKASTVNRYFEVLRHLFNQAIEDNLVKYNPVSKYYTPFIEDGARRALSRTEIQKILDACKHIQDHSKTRIQSVFYDIHVFALSTGMRVGEIINLKRSYIQGDMILYPITKTKHRRRSRSNKRKFKAVALNNSAMSIINKHKEGEYVFDLPRRSSDIIRKNIHKVRRMTGIKDYSFHMLRHTVSSILAQETSLVTAKEILGHADIKTTLQYSHVNFQRLKYGVAKLENYFFKDKR